MRGLWGLLSIMVVAGELSGADPKVTVVLDGLDNPAGVAIQPEGGVFVSESGAGRVVMVGADGKAQERVTGFSLDVYGKGPTVNIGPLGLAFASKNVLVVGDGGKPDGEELLRVYDLPEDGTALPADRMKASFSLAANGEIPGEGNFFGVAAAPGAVFVTCHGDDAKGWIAKCDIKEDGSFGPFARFVATKEAVQVDAPAAITLDNLGNIVVGQMGEVDSATDSLLTFYHSKSGKLEAKFTTELYDVAALAYYPNIAGNPKRGKLYALDFAWSDPTRGGLFEIVAKADDKASSTAKKIVPLMKPTAMAFDANGVLYVTILGDAKEGDPAKAGQLLKIEL